MLDIPKVGDYPSWFYLMNAKIEEVIPGKPAEIRAFATKLGTAGGTLQTVLDNLQKIDTEHKWTGDAGKAFLADLRGPVIQNVQKAVLTHTTLKTALLGWAKTLEDVLPGAEKALKDGGDAYADSILMSAKKQRKPYDKRMDDASRVLTGARSTIETAAKAMKSTYLDEANRGVPSTYGAPK